MSISPQPGIAAGTVGTAAACCVLFSRKGGSVSYNGIEVELLSASRSADLTSALLDIGLVSLHLAAPGVLNTIDLPRCPTTVALLLDYAIDIAPRLPEEPDVIDGAAVIDKAAAMRSCYLDPETDAELIRTIGAIAQMSIDGLVDLAVAPTSPQEGVREQ